MRTLPQGHRATCHCAKCRQEKSADFVVEPFARFGTEATDFSLLENDLADEQEAEMGRRWPAPQRGMSARPRPGVRTPPRRTRRRWPGRRRHGLTVLGPEPTVIEAPPPSDTQASEHVRWVQNRLNQIMNLNLPVDGMMSVETRSALRSFQERQGLPADGIVGPDTERALIAARSGQSLGAGATKSDEPGMTEPDSAKPAAEFGFEWEVTPLGQREAPRPAARYRMVNPAKVSCANLNRNLPIFKAIGTKDPVGVLEAVSQRAVEMLDNTIAEMNRIQQRVRAGEPLAWPLIDDLLAWSLKTRMLMRVNDPKAWTDKGTDKDRRTARLIIRWLSNIRKIIAGGQLRYTCLASSNCGSSTWAWVFCDKYRINLCRRFWHAKAGIDAATHFEFQAQTIIHEASHIYYCTEDAGLGPGAAECISQFVADANGSAIDENFVGRCGPKEPTLS